MSHHPLLLPRHIHQLWSGRLLALAIFLIAFTITEILHHTELARLEAFNRSSVLSQASTMRAALDSELNSTLFLASGLVGYVEVHRTLETDETQRVLATIFRQGNHLRNIGLAPGNRLSFVYPLRENEQALGLYYPDLPNQWPAVKSAIERHETVLAGPVDLVQGGRGLIARTPVFLDDGSYWGLLSVVLDSDALLMHTGLTSQRGDIRFALRGKDGLGAKGEMIIGEPSLFASDAVLLDMKVPGGEWQLAAMPTTGWRQGEDHLFWYRIGGWGVALLLAFLFYRTASERLMVELAGLHDTLTGLPNRRLFEDRLAQCIFSAQRDKERFALLYLDLDGFKPINDRYGHKAGDHVLVEIAKRLRTQLRKADTVARIGGDEFVILLPHLLCVEEAMNVTSKLINAISEPITVAGHELLLGCSIGVSLYPDHGREAEELLKSADQAMYTVKSRGKNNVSIAPSVADIMNKVA